MVDRFIFTGNFVFAIKMSEKTLEPGFCWLFGRFIYIREHDKVRVVDAEFR